MPVILRAATAWAVHHKHLGPRLVPVGSTGRGPLPLQQTLADWEGPE